MNCESSSKRPIPLFRSMHAAFAHLKRFLAAHPALLLLYWAVFLAVFELSERGFGIQSYHIVQVVWDNYIPYNSIFVIPYIAWFFFVGGMTVYTFFCEKAVFLRYMTFVAVTYSVGLILFFAFPSIQYLRPTVFVNPTLFDRLVIGLYASDTNTGVFPSLHVTGQLAVLLAAFRCERFRSLAWRAFFVLSSVLVCASTVFIKQHSLLDVFAGILICAAAYPLVYGKKSRRCVG